MWGLPLLLLLLLLLCLSPPPGAATPPPPAQNESGPDLQSPGPSSAPPATPTPLPSHSEAPALRLNLGLNFQVKVRSRGKGQPHEGPARAATRPPPPHSQPDAPDRSPTEAAGGSAGAGRAEEPLAGPTAGASNGSSSARAPPAPQPSATPLRPREHSSELEFQVDIGLTAGLGQEEGPVLGGGGSLLPVLADALGMGGQGGGPGLFGFTLPPELWKPPEWNVTGSPLEESEDPPSTAEGTLEPGAAESSGSQTVPRGNEEAFVALPACLPDRPDACGSPRPEPGTSQLLPSGPLFVPLHSDWTAALAAWGPAWEGHVYGAGALFALLAALALLALLALPCRRRRLAAPEGRLLGLLSLLLLGAGGARAGLLFGQADGRRRERLPALAVRLLRDLPLPCLTSALAATLLLLWRRPRAKLSARPGLRPPCLLALLLLGHFSAAAGAVLAAERLPVLLLASRGLFALLAALLSAALLGCSCLARGEAAQVYDLRSAPPPACQGSFASGRRWSRAARAASPAAAFGLLSAGLHAYSVLHALGYGLSPALFGPWPWWALQLSCRLCEAGVGLPLAAFGLYLICGCSAAACCRRLALRPARPAAKAPVLPSSLHWALSQHEKLAGCGDAVVRSQSDYLPLCAVPTEGALDARRTAPGWSVLSLAAEAADPTADFQPPSPIDLRRSIDEALCSEGLLRGSGAFSASSILSLASDPERHLPRAASCLQLGPVQPQDDGAAVLQPRAAATRPSSPASPSGSAARPSPSRPSSLASSPAAGDPRGVPPERSGEVSLASAGQPGEDAAPTQEEPLEVSRQADAVSVGSDTIDL